jgi:hemerythrin-like domain-containing protein
MSNRRAFLVGATGLVFAGAARADKDEDEVSPTEDLMREHGLLRRLLLVYDEMIRRSTAGEAMPVDPVARAAHIVRVFVEDYHEADEEQYVFPCFQAAGRELALVEILVRQHRAGRYLTSEIARAAVPSRWNEAATRHAATSSMRSFVQMYSAHAAREDTTLFPAYAKLVGDRSLKRVQDRFEAIEHALPSGDFEKMLAEVVDIERSLDINDLDRVTPPPPANGRW